MSKKSERKRAWKTRKQVKKLQRRALSDFEKEVRRKSEYTQRKINLAAVGCESYREYLQTELWKTIRARVLHRDGYFCQCCRAATATEVHHTSYGLAVLQGKWDDALISICRACHQSAEFSEDVDCSDFKVGPTDATRTISDLKKLARLHKRRDLKHKRATAFVPELPKKQVSEEALRRFDDIRKKAADERRKIAEAKAARKAAIEKRKKIDSQFDKQVRSILWHGKIDRRIAEADSAARRESRRLG